MFWSNMLEKLSVVLQKGDFHLRQLPFLLFIVMCFSSYKMEILTTYFLHHAQFGAMLMDMCEEQVEADTLRSKVTIEVFFSILL